MKPTYMWLQVIPLIIQDQFYTIQNLQRSPIPQTSNWSGTFFCFFLRQTSSRVEHQLSNRILIGQIFKKKLSTSKIIYVSWLFFVYNFWNYTCLNLNIYDSFTVARLDRPSALTIWYRNPKPVGKPLTILWVDNSCWCSRSKLKRWNPRMAVP